MLTWIQSIKSIKSIKRKAFLITAVGAAIFCAAPVYAEGTSQDYVTVDKVNFRQGPSTDAEIIEVVSPGTAVFVTGNEQEWSMVSRNGVDGYIKTEYIMTQEEYDSRPQKSVELLTWQEARGVFTTGVAAEITDVRTGLTYYVKSFSNGNHADVEPITYEDTQTMLRTYGGSWDWDARPIWVTINGRTMAASINGMPHGGGVNNNNGMNGQVCIHFKGSTTHNGNRSHEADHQSCVMEAYNAAY